jgi:hypothetical protein
MSLLLQGRVRYCLPKAEYVFYVESTDCLIEEAIQLLTIPRTAGQVSS